MKILKIYFIVAMILIESVARVVGGAEDSKREIILRIEKSRKVKAQKYELD